MPHINKKLGAHHGGWWGVYVVSNMGEVIGELVMKREVLFCDEGGGVYYIERNNFGERWVYRVMRSKAPFTVDPSTRDEDGFIAYDFRSRYSALCDNKRRVLKPELIWSSREGVIGEVPEWMMGYVLEQQFLPPEW